MTVIAALTKAKGRGVRKVEVLTATGPAADVSVGAGATADFDIAISPELKPLDSATANKVSGLPANILVSQIDFSDTAITFRAVNPTAAAITITAKSLTISVEAVGTD